jgi:hypothetical protein
MPSVGHVCGTFGVVVAAGGGHGGAGLGVVGGATDYLELDVLVVGVLGVLG